MGILDLELRPYSHLTGSPIAYSLTDCVKGQIKIKQPHTPQQGSSKAKMQAHYAWC
jgi:hypothetical protein